MKAIRDIIRNTILINKIEDHVYDHHIWWYINNHIHDPIRTQIQLPIYNEIKRYIDKFN